MDKPSDFDLLARKILDSLESRDPVSMVVRVSVWPS
jgi:hypothetical protein